MARKNAEKESQRRPVGGSVVSGEALCEIEWCEDNDEVWFTVRALDAPNSLLYRFVPGLAW